VYNVRAVLEGRLELTPALGEEVYDCLACRGCESVCPAGVPVGNIVEEFRGLLGEERKESGLGRALKRLMLSGVVASPPRLSFVLSLLRFGERTGLRSLLRHLLRGLAPGLYARESLLPALSSGDAPRLPRELPAIGTRRGRVALFRGCIASELFADVNVATARVLARNGFDVVVPADQACCGALHLHNGLPDTARALARRNVRAFHEEGLDAIIVNAAGCGAALGEYHELLANDDSDAHEHEHERVAAFARRVVDVSAFLAREGFAAPKASPFRVQDEHRVAYDPPCHLFHAQGVRDEPRTILESIPGVRLIEHRDAERCCGSAGIYNVTHYEMSMQVLEEKMDALADARPETIVTGNPGCHLQLQAGAKRRGLNAEIVHPVVLLDRAYTAEESS
jgi:glycolate oxidase iron-sulfur subunit